MKKEKIEKSEMSQNAGKIPYEFLKPVYDIPDLLKIIPVGRSTIYKEIKTGRLCASKMGKRTVFLLPNVLRWLEGISLYSEQAQLASTRGD